MCNVTVSEPLATAPWLSVGALSACCHRASARLCPLPIFDLRPRALTLSGCSYDVCEVSEDCCGDGSINMRAYDVFCDTDEKTCEYDLGKKGRAGCDMPFCHPDDAA